jgi:hypothetical protein
LTLFIWLIAWWGREGEATRIQPGRIVVAPLITLVLASALLAGPAVTVGASTAVAGPLLVGGTVLSLITWLPFADGPVSFWVVWLAWCGPVLLLTAIAALFSQPHRSSSAELPAEYRRYEQRTVPHRPSLY